MRKIRNKIIKILGGIPLDLHKHELEVAELEGALRAYRNMFNYIKQQENYPTIDYSLLWLKIKSYVADLYDRKFISYDKAKSKYNEVRLL